MSSKNSLNNYKGSGPIFNKLRIKALIAYPDVIFSELSTPNFRFIISTIPISSISPATISKWSIFSTVIPFLKKFSEFANSRRLTPKQNSGWKIGSWVQEVA